MELGEELGWGVRSVVYAWGEDDVVKVPSGSTPDSWLVHELWLMDAAERAGAHVPDRRRLVEVDGRRALAMERIVGPSMWELLVAEPDRAGELGRQLALVQAALATSRPSYEMPAQRDRLASKIHMASRRHGDDLGAVLDLLPDDGTLVLCHGDLHPRNVLLAEQGPMLVDWYDASRGLLSVEIARTALMLELSGQHSRPPAPASAVVDMRAHYLAAACEVAGLHEHELAPLHLVQEVARLAEGLGDDRVATVRRRLAAFGCSRPTA